MIFETKEDTETKSSRSNSLKADDIEEEDMGYGFGEGMNYEDMSASMVNVKTSKEDNGALLKASGASTGADTSKQEASVNSDALMNPNNQLARQRTRQGNSMDIFGLNGQLKNFRQSAA